MRWALQSSRQQRAQNRGRLEPWILPEPGPAKDMPLKVLHGILAEPGIVSVVGVLVCSWRRETGYCDVPRQPACRDSDRQKKKIVGTTSVPHAAWSYMDKADYLLWSRSYLEQCLQGAWCGNGRGVHTVNAWS